MCNYYLLVSPSQTLIINEHEAEQLNRQGLIVWKRCHSAYVPERGVTGKQIGIVLAECQRGKNRK